MREPIEPIAIPAALLKDDAPATRPSDLAGHPAVYRARLQATDFVRGKQLRRTNYRLLHILDRQGVEDFSTIQFSFDPVIEQLYVNKLEVRDESGKLISSGNPSDYYLVDDRSASGIASTERTLNVPVPGLKPGCTLEYQYTIRRRAKRISVAIR